MKTKAKQLRELADEELKDSDRERMKEYFELRKTQVAGKLENPLQLREIRRTIARIKTVLNERKRERIAKNGATDTEPRKA